jgi:2-keto-3-deoxy-6-phosphogluconate aldolase
LGPGSGCAGGGGFTTTGGGFTATGVTGVGVSVGVKVVDAIPDEDIAGAPMLQAVHSPPRTSSASRLGAVDIDREGVPTTRPTTVGAGVS